MIDSDEVDQLRQWINRWIKIGNRAHGYAGVFNYENADDKVTVELNTAREWCRSIVAEFGLTVGDPERNHDDPPDCYVSVGGQRLGVELVQLIESEHKRRAAKNETPHAGQLFHDMQWSKPRLASKLNEVIQKKGNKYEKNGKSIDVLLIHCAEPWLSSGQVRDWLADIQMGPHPNIASTFLLLDYEPGRNVEYWPVFRLYGDLGGTI
ncbi:hypothetical protein FFK22_017985 [Mycobacterium sp. KBS0706]|uniref:hypothetical protein n=1 Tax=Mycobacterium sp. KBS0706 TaxID=2578109 RepID=UPI00110FE830|nr:hypothetical protein [Mycobacterium sp. KBS0706]TSD87387.1 hypothetical protein FFK22_017985 [Mycobacterium sp. KBS0706]